MTTYVCCSHWLCLSLFSLVLLSLFICPMCFSLHSMFSYIWAPVLPSPSWLLRTTFLIWQFALCPCFDVAHLSLLGRSTTSLVLSALRFSAVRVAPLPAVFGSSHPLFLCRLSRGFGSSFTLSLSLVVLSPLCFLRLLLCLCVLLYPFSSLCVSSLPLFSPISLGGPLFLLISILILLLSHSPLLPASSHMGLSRMLFCSTRPCVLCFTYLVVFSLLYGPSFSVYLFCFFVSLISLFCLYSYGQSLMSSSSFVSFTSLFSLLCDLCSSFSTSL